MSTRWSPRGTNGCEGDAGGDTGCLTTGTSSTQLESSVLCKASAHCAGRSSLTRLFKVPKRTGRQEVEKDRQRGREGGREGDRDRDREEWGALHCPDLRVHLLLSSSDTVAAWNKTDLKPNDGQEDRRGQEDSRTRTWGQEDTRTGGHGHRLADQAASTISNRCWQFGELPLSSPAPTCTCSHLYLHPPGSPPTYTHLHLHLPASATQEQLFRSTVEATVTWVSSGRNNITNTQLDLCHMTQMLSADNGNITSKAGEDH